MNMPGTNQPLTDAELVEVHAILDSMTDGLESGELDGFLTAVCSAPCVIPIENWLGTVVGDFEFKTDSDAARFGGLIFRRYNEVLQFLVDEETVWPLPSMNLDQAAEWCGGFMRGVREDSDWNKDEEALLHLYSIAALAGEFDLEGEQDADGNIIEDALPQLVKFQAALPQAVQVLDQHWEEERMLALEEGQPAISNKQDRNAPCACGSGRKFKKCCGK